MKYLLASLLTLLPLTTNASCVIQATTGDDITSSPISFDRELGPVRVYSGNVLDLQVLLFLNSTEGTVLGTLTTADGDVVSRFEAPLKKLEDLDGRGVEEYGFTYRFACESTEI